MRIVSIAIALLLTLTMLPPTASAEADLYAENRIALIEELGDKYQPDAVGTSSLTGSTPVTMDEMVSEAAAALTEVNVRLSDLLAPQPDVVPNDFPIVSSAAGIGLSLEFGAWASRLPVSCANNVHVHQASTPAGDAPPLYASTASYATFVNIALGTDILGQMPQFVSYGGTEVFATGAGLGVGCIDFEFCIWNFCISFLLNLMALVSGVITDDITGTNTLSAVHSAAEPVLP